ncbi:uncharacterized protein LOC114951960 [Acropora millepora]|uniref:uncharacterized protein LOC114951960 n=1 Tax=Acropora millepora TaxID=45264 RepID=UPI001CF3FBC4|nr:uncharacterized protein LOC114951960 [Acropora millepora]
MLPFLIHSFEELCGQARADNKGMMVVLLKSRRKGDAKRGTLLRILHNVESQHDKNWLFWVADTWSSDGRKVFHVYVGDQRSDRLLFLTPSTGRNATFLGEIADTGTDTCDAVLQNIMVRAALRITDDHQQRKYMTGQVPLHFTLQRRSEVVLQEHHIKGQEVLDIYERKLQANQLLG